MKELNVNISINVDEDIDINMYDNLVITGITHNSRVLKELKIVSDENNVNVKTIRRRFKFLKKKNKTDYCISLGNKKFVSDKILGHQINFSSAGTLKDGHEKLLRSQEWDYFGCVRYQKNWNVYSTKTHMDKFFDKLCKNFPDSKFRMYFTTENNIDKGHHSHFVLWSDNKSFTLVKKTIELHFRGSGTDSFGNTWIERYDPEKGGAGYILKEIHQHPDGWDFHRNDD